MLKKGFLITMLSSFVLVALFMGFNVLNTQAAEDVNFGPGGPNGGMRGNGVLRDYVIKALAESLGMTVDDLNARLNKGDSMRTIALEKGWTADQFQTKMTEVYNKAIDYALADGKIDQQQADILRQRMSSSVGRGGRRGGNSDDGLMNGYLKDYTTKAMAEALGISVEDYQGKLDAGKRPLEIARELGINVQDFATKMTASMTKALSQAVTDGKITQGLADWMIDRMKNRPVNSGIPGGDGGTQLPTY